MRVVRLELDRDRCSAGETIAGRLRGGASVALVRVEHQHERRTVFTVARADVDADGSFALTVPDTALPSAVGEDCALSYVALPDGSLDAPGAPLAVEARARLHLDTGTDHIDRLLSSWDARHFHLELAEAQLGGGGTLRGRLHRHGSWPSGRIVVRARCLECRRVTAAHDPRLPQWRQRALWEVEQPVRVEPDARWAPFGFDIPESMPPAVEATTIAWRYELLAERDVRHWFNETAALTPLLHEDPAR